MSLIGQGMPEKNHLVIQQLCINISRMSQTQPFLSL